MNLWMCTSGLCHSDAQPAAGPPGIIEENCRTQGCCWDPLKTIDPHIDLADCFFANNGRSDYQLVHSEQQGMSVYCSASNAGGHAAPCLLCTASENSCTHCTCCRDSMWLMECACLPHSGLLQVCIGLQI